MVDRVMSAGLNKLQWPQEELLGSSVNAFLEALGGPTCIWQSGRHRQPRRALATLMHGDEPSGIRGLWDWFKSGAVPYADTLFIIGNVEAALEAPGFAYRHRDDERDLNRCFKPPFTGRQGELCENLLTIIEQFAPACLIDVHNTSGVGPAFGVTPSHTEHHEALLTGFSEKLIVTDIRLGALMEAADEMCPTVTVECGGAIDTYADGVATQGIVEYLNAADPRECGERDVPMEVLHYPVRVELKTPHSIGYGDGPNQEDVVLANDVERFNFGIVEPDDRLGWLGDPGLDALTAKTTDSREVLHEVLTMDADRALRPAQAVKLFMVTTKAQAAAEDCLFYAVRADGQPW